MKVGLKVILSVSTLLMLLMACASGEEVITEAAPTSELLLPEDTDTPVPTQTPVPTDTPIPTETLIPTITISPTVRLTSTPLPPSPTVAPLTVSLPGLSANGPWLVFNDTSGIWALNPDGTGLTRIVDHPMIDPPMGMVIYPSPSGGRAAFLEFQTNFYATPSIYLLSLQDAEWWLLAQPLYDAVLEAVEQNYLLYEDVIAITGPWNRFAWSPDGRYLAYIGALEGKHSDLFVFDTSTGEVTRMTHHQTHPTSPQWSPDSRTIVYGGANSLGWGSSGWGYSMDAYWAVHVDSTEVQQLFDSEVNRGKEYVLGWISDRAFLIDSLASHCPYQNLRIVDADTGAATVLWSDGYDARAFDPESMTMVFIILEEDRLDPECAPESEAGIYLLDVQSTITTHLLAENPNLYDHVFWSPGALQFFLYGDENIMTISPQGDRIEYSSPPLGIDPLVVSPSGEQWAMISSDGLWIGTDDGEMFEIYSGRVHHPTWNLDEEILFFFAEEEFSVLYMARFPNYEPVVISTEIVEDHVWGNVSYLNWVWP